MSCSFLYNSSCISYYPHNKDTRWHCRADIHLKALSKWTNLKILRPYFDTKIRVIILTFSEAWVLRVAEEDIHLTFQKHQSMPIYKRTQSHGFYKISYVSSEKCYILPLCQQKVRSELSIIGKATDMDHLSIQWPVGRNVAFFSNHDTFHLVKSNLSLSPLHPQKIISV